MFANVGRTSSVQAHIELIVSSTFLSLLGQCVAQHKSNSIVCAAALIRHVCPVCKQAFNSLSDILHFYIADLRPQWQLLLAMLGAP